MRTVSIKLSGLVQILAIIIEITKGGRFAFRTFYIALEKLVYAPNAEYSD